MTSQSKLYANAKRATVKEARGLKIGDIIECYYVDSETPSHEMVIRTTRSSKEGGYSGIRTIALGHMGMRNKAICAPMWLNTDKFKRIAHGADIGCTLAETAKQASGVASLTDALNQQARLTSK